MNDSDAKPRCGICYYYHRVSQTSGRCYGSPPPGNVSGFTSSRPVVGEHDPDCLAYREDATKLPVRDDPKEIRETARQVSGAGLDRGYAHFPDQPEKKASLTPPKGKKRGYL